MVPCLPKMAGGVEQVIAADEAQLWIQSTQLRKAGAGKEKVSLVALDGTAPLAIAARAQARDAVDRLAVRTSGFRFAAVDNIHSPLFLPGGAKYHDLPGMLAVAAPGELWIGGEGDEGDSLLVAAYRAAGKRDAITLDDGSLPLTRWLLSSGE